MEAPAPENVPFSGSASESATSLADTFSPEAHSWIMVPDADVPLPVPGNHDGAPSLPLATEEAAVAASALLPLPSSTPASPTMLRETGDIVASLAVSEILSAESAWPLPLSQTSPPLPLSCCDASYDEPTASTTYASERAAEARKLGALAYPPTDSQMGGCKAPGKVGQEGLTSSGTVGSETESEADMLDLIDPLLCSLQTWARPLALVAVLVASHAACILLGVALGKAQSKEASLTMDSAPQLARRFSSGASGTHARLCVA